MDERNNALGLERRRQDAMVWRLSDAMDMEAEFFGRLVRDVEGLRDSFQKKQWTDSLTIAQGLESSARAIEKAEEARRAAFASLKDGLGAPMEEPFSAVLGRVPEDERDGLDESWRRLKGSVFRLKTATGRLRYSADTMSDTLNRVLEGIFPHRRGKIYTRHGTASTVVGALLVDKEL